MRDYVDTGDALRITIPFNDPNSEEYYLVENHQRINIYDAIINGGSAYGNPSIGKGIYIWKVVGNEDNDYPPDIRAVTADGTFDWLYVGDFYAGPGWYVNQPWEGYLPETKRNGVNRYAGKSDRHPEHIYWNSHFASKWVDQNHLGAWEITRNVMGDEYDPYNVGYNQLLTPWSNPSTTKLVGGQQQPTNISVQIYSQNGNNITVKAYSESASGESLPPSKPQNLKMSLTTDRHPKLSWDKNLEPDMSQYKVYRSTNPNTDFTQIGTATHNPFLQTITYIDYTITVPLPREPQGTIYYYRVTARDNQPLESVKSDYVSAVSDQISKDKEEQNEIAPSSFLLFDNYPNPFNPSTTIDFLISEKSFVTLKVYDMLGREIAELVNEELQTGSFEKTFDASSLSSGVYIYRITAIKDGKILFNESRQMLMIK